MSNCGHCHTCGTPLRQCLDGEEWCHRCQDYKRYRCHGWAEGYDPDTVCPDPMAATSARLNICEHGPHGYEVQRNNHCAFVANASRNKADNYAAAVAWGEAHPEVAE